jgi:hypothetical protein
MGYRNGVPMKFKPRGVVDSQDGMNSVPGGMSSLANLIPDPSTTNAFQCRPANTLQEAFASGPFSNPGFVSVALEINNFVYGTVATSRTVGYDEPFCYNLATGLFVTVSGVTNANVPVSPSTTGEWNTPTMAVMGPNVVVTHPGFNTTNGYFGWFDVTNPAAPVWHSGNTTTNALTAVPAGVQLFYNRLYFAVSNTLQFTDTLSLNRTNASQSLTAGDTSVVTALSLFTLTTTTQGILQGLLAFKANTVFQVTGDAALGTLAINSLNTAAGTVAPNSVVPTPAGVFFVAPDGIRIVQADGTVSEPDTDLRLPFLNAVYKSRINASYNSDVYRVCVQNGGKAGSPWEEYWYDIGREVWTGPHSFQQDIALPYGTGFLLFSHLNPGNMYSGQVQQLIGSGFTEAGSPLVWTYATSPIGEDESMAVNCVNVATINMAFSSGSPPVSCTAADQSAGVLAVAVINPPSTVITTWGSFIWGAAVWFGYQFGISPYLIPWTNPVVFTKLVFQATAQSSLGFKISNLRMMNQPADYVIPWNLSGNTGAIPTPSGFIWDSSSWDGGATWPA